MTGAADQQQVFIALGSNLGDRRENLCRALTVLAETNGVSVRQVSSIYETAPVDGPPVCEIGPADVEVQQAVQGIPLPLGAADVRAEYDPF